jgi:hypothetical protein
MKNIVSSCVAILLSAASAYAAPRDAAELRTTFAGARLIYLASGVTDSGDGANAGTATSVHCTNFGPANATVYIRFYRNDSTFAGHSKTVLLSMSTLTVRPTAWPHSRTRRLPAAPTRSSKDLRG